MLNLTHRIPENPRWGGRKVFLDSLPEETTEQMQKPGNISPCPSAYSR